MEVENKMDGLNPEQSSDEDAVSSINTEWLAELSESDSEEQEPEPAPDQRNMERCVDAARMFKLRRALGQLDHDHQQKEEALLTASEQLRECRQHMQELLELRDKLEEDMRSHKDAENSAALFRVRARHRKLCTELQNEEELESVLKASVHKSQMELCEAEVEQVMASSLRQKVQEEERTFSLHKQQKAMRRLQLEKENSSRNRRNKSHQTDDKASAQKEEEKTMPSANSSRLMRETMLRARRREADRRQESEELQENRRQAVKALQSNISASHRRVTASRPWPQKEDCERWTAHTGPELEKAQKQRQMKEKPQTKEHESGGKVMEELQLDSAVKAAPESERFTQKPFHAQRRRREHSDSEDSSESEEDQTDLAVDLEEPEFDGMWAHDYKERPSAQTHARQETTNETLNASKTTCKETRGPLFVSKPELLHFKDFEVKQVYKKKVVLKNVSFSTNVCRFVGVSVPLNNCLFISFEPPGALSTGMSCELQATFQPQVNEDLEGEIRFASASGTFSVPVRCSTKKCQMEVDFQCLDFGSQLVGQTVTRVITLTNRGALACGFSLDMSSRSCAENISTDVCRCARATSTQGSECDEPETDKEKIPESEVECSQNQEKIETAETETHSNQATTDSSHFNDDTECDVHFGSVTEGHIKPFQSIKLDVIFKPTIPGDTKLTFYIHFTDSSCPTIAVQVKASALDVPVWISQSTIDMNICLWDQLYHHWVHIHSRSNTAIKVTFEVCPGLRRHVEMVPKTGFVQAQSSFKALLKFQPRASLREDLSGLLDQDTGVLEAPVEVHTAGQSLEFTVSAVLTSSDLGLEPSLVDFGSCSLEQAVRSSVRLTNLSLLPQDFGFCNIPQFVEVQPNDGFGTLLPQESLHLDLIFRPKKVKVYDFQLCCKTGLDRDVLVSCRGVGVRPPLELSHSAIHFGATALGHCSSALVYIMNVERPLTPAQPRLFCFHLPQHSDVSVSPSNGRLMPGERCVVQVTFRPKLPELNQDDSETLTKAEASVEKSESRSEVKPEEQLSDGLRWSQHHGQLTVICSVSDPVSQRETDEAPSWSSINTLYLQLQCPVTQPPLVVISHSGENTVDFHRVAVGHVSKQKCVVQNRSEVSLHLSSSVLPVNGPFFVLNAVGPLRPLEPGQSRSLLLGFCPSGASKYCERLELRCHQGALYLNLCGEGVLSEVTCSPSDPQLDFGHVLLTDSFSHTLQIQNHSALEVGFRVCLSSQTPPTLQGRGRSLSSRCSAFSVVPAGGRLSPGESQDLQVCFQPDQESQFYRERLTVELSNQSVVCAMDLQGAACSYTMYLSGGDVVPCLWDSTGTEDDPVPVLLTLKGHSRRGQRPPVVRQIQIGCVASSQSSKKPAEFFWENLSSEQQQQGFSLEPSKGAVQAGTSRTLTITWTPPCGYEPLELLQSCVCLTLKSDTITVYNVTLMALMTSDP